MQDMLATPAVKHLAQPSVAQRVTATTSAEPDRQVIAVGKDDRFQLGGNLVGLPLVLLYVRIVASHVGGILGRNVVLEEDRPPEAAKCLPHELRFGRVRRTVATTAVIRARRNGAFQPDPLIDRHPGRRDHHRLGSAEFDCGFPVLLQVRLESRFADFNGDSSHRSLFVSQDTASGWGFYGFNLSRARRLSQFGAHRHHLDAAMIG